MESTNPVTKHLPFIGFEAIQSMTQWDYRNYYLQLWGGFSARQIRYLLETRTSPFQQQFENRLQNYQNSISHARINKTPLKNQFKPAFNEVKMYLTEVALHNYIYSIVDMVTRRSGNPIASRLNLKDKKYVIILLMHLAEISHGRSQVYVNLVKLFFYQGAPHWDTTQFTSRETKKANKRFAKKIMYDIFDLMQKYNATYTYRSNANKVSDSASNCFWGAVTKLLVKSPSFGVVISMIIANSERYQSLQKFIVGARLLKAYKLEHNVDVTFFKMYKALSDDHEVTIESYPALPDIHYIDDSDY